MSVALVGVDCATDPAKVGAALGKWQNGSVSVLEATLCRKKPPAQVVGDWIAGLDEPVLLALDAPLGWPASLGEALQQHFAGAEVTVEPNRMFRRETDRFIRDAVGKTPLDVGADRIARTAHAALKFLGELRRALNSPVPLAWSPRELPAVSAIEVYPAATLVARGIRSAGYKKRRNVEERKEIIEALGAHLTLPSDAATLEANADALDAVVCLLAAKDFLEARAMPPLDRALAEREGWIWCTSRSAESET